MILGTAPLGTLPLGTVVVESGGAVSITAINASNITQTTATITVSRSNPAAGTLYFVIVPQGVTPTWSRSNIGTNSGWTATTIAYHDADTDPGSGSTYQFVPDASGLTAGTPYDLWAVWDDGATTVGPVQGTGFTTAATGIAPSVGHVTVNGYTATVSQPFTVFPAAGRAAAHGYVPSIEQPVTVAAVKGGAQVRGYAPGIVQDNGQTVFPSGGRVQFAGYVVGIVQPRNISPVAGRITATGYAPGVDQSARVSPSSGEILVRGYVAGITQPRIISPLAGRSSLRGYAPGVQQLSSTYPITLEQVRLLYSIYRLHGLAEPLNTSPTSREVASLLQSVSSAGASTVVETSSLPSDVPADPGLLIEELAALHGLTTPLTVTTTSRTAGTIVQSFSAVGSSITVTRQ